MVRIGINTSHTSFSLAELVCKSLLRSRHFTCHMGRDPRLPTTLDMDTKTIQEQSDTGATVRPIDKPQTEPIKWPILE